jgi:alkanesulfonate monooxygenase SsuD/methylene tetrahydromethanopterin reductase-like flavin-dependent oxidoreductase (luciferase family)
MKYGFVIPGGDDIHEIVEFAKEIEKAGWDGVFLPDGISIDVGDMDPMPWFDSSVTMAAIAAATERVRIGTMVTAIPRRRPWKLAQEITTLDHLSRGRMILPVGTGAAPHDAGFYRVGEVMDVKGRATRMGESLKIISGLWAGERVYHEGEHYKVDGLRMSPTPLQKPRVPIWVVAMWPRPLSVDRAMLYDGIIPQVSRPEGGGNAPTPDDIRAIRAHAEERRGKDTPFDIIYEGETPGDNPDEAAAKLRPLAEAGVTWWIESRWEAPSRESLYERVRQGPPRI